MSTSITNFALAIGKKLNIGHTIDTYHGKKSFDFIVA